MNIYQVISRPIITEKGLAAKDEQRTLCFVAFLVFVNQYVAELRLPLLSHFVVLLQELEGKTNQVIKVDALVSA